MNQRIAFALFVATSPGALFSMQLETKSESRHKRPATLLIKSLAKAARCPDPKDVALPIELKKPITLLQKAFAEIAREDYAGIENAIHFLVEYITIEQLHQDKSVHFLLYLTARAQRQESYHRTDAFIAMANKKQPYKKLKKAIDCEHQEALPLMTEYEDRQLIKNFLLFFAIKQNNVKNVRQLIEAGADRNALLPGLPTTLLKLAIKENFLDIVDALFCNDTRPQVDDVQDLVEIISRYDGSLEKETFVHLAALIENSNIHEAT